MVAKMGVRLLSVLLFSAVWSSSAVAYDNVRITNQTEFEFRGTVKYMGCPSDAVQIKAATFDAKGNPTYHSWTAKSRGALKWCLVTGIEATGGKLVGDKPSSLIESERRQRSPDRYNGFTTVNGQNFGGTTNVVAYDSTGTGYSTFYVKPFGDRYRIFSEQEWTKVSGTSSSKSPGFLFINKTGWPVAYSLDQVGCLYHDTIAAGTAANPGRKKVNTGSVWFTLRVHIQPDGKTKSDWACVKPVAKLILDIAVTTAISVATGGAGTMGMASMIMDQGAAAAMRTAATAAANTAATQVAAAAAKATATKIATGLVMAEITDGAKDWSSSYFQNNASGFGTVSMWGQYAGYDWPFRCNDMPTYEITGGPFFTTKAGRLVIEDRPLVVKKINKCGNDMMAGSPQEGITHQEERRAGPYILGYALQIDCHLKGVDGESSKYPLTFRFYSGNKLVAEKEERITCDWTQDGYVSIGHAEKDSAEVTHVDVINKHGDSFLIDEMMMEIYSGPAQCEDYGTVRKEVLVGNQGTRLWWCKQDQHQVVNHWGRDGGKGYCLNAQATVPSGWGPYVSGCYYGLRFHTTGASANGASPIVNPKAAEAQQAALRAAEQVQQQAEKIVVDTVMKSGLADLVDGQNVFAVEYGNLNNDKQAIGRIIQAKPGVWWEVKPNFKTRIFTEYQRDPWSVYLRDGAVLLQLDLWQKKVYYAERDLANKRPLYSVVGSLRPKDSKKGKPR